MKRFLFKPLSAFRSLPYRFQQCSTVFKQLFILTCLSAMPGFTAIAGNEAQNLDPRVERIRKELGYYQNGEQQNNEDLAEQVRILRDEMRQIRADQDSRLQRIENLLKHSQAKELGLSTKPSSVDSKSIEASKAVAVVSVCSQGCDFNDLQKAVDAAVSGGEIVVAPEINGTCAIITKPLHIIGKKGKEGRRAHLVGGVCNGKAPLVTAAANIVIEGFEISGIAVGDGNGACIRLDHGTRDLTVRDVYCHDNQDGILGNSDGLFLIENSTFSGNGFGDGQAHGVYIGGDEVLIRHCRILSTQNAGHSLKLGPRKLTVEDSVIAALNGRNSRALDAYAGGEIVMLRNVIQQGPQSDNSDVIGLGLEAARLQPGKHSLRMVDNWVVFDPPGRGVLFSGRTLGSIIVQNNTFVGLKGMGMDGIPDTGNRWFKNRGQAGLPEFDGTPSSLPVGVTKE